MPKSCRSPCKAAHGRDQTHRHCKVSAGAEQENDCTNELPKQMVLPMSKSDWWALGPLGSLRIYGDYTGITGVPAEDYIGNASAQPFGTQAAAGICRIPGGTPSLRPWINIGLLFLTQLHADSLFLLYPICLENLECLSPGQESES